MDSKDITLYAKVVDLTKTDWTKSSIPELSERVYQLIAESGAPSLQKLRDSNTKQDMMKMLEAYWAR
jgi:hypothetical protein